MQESTPLPRRIVRYLSTEDIERITGLTRATLAIWSKRRIIATSDKRRFVDRIWTPQEAYEAAVLARLNRFQVQSGYMAVRDTLRELATFERVRLHPLWLLLHKRDQVRLYDRDAAAVADWKELGVAVVIPLHDVAREMYPFITEDVLQ